MVSIFLAGLDLGMWVNTFLPKGLLRALGKSFPFFETLVLYLKDKEIEFYQAWHICGIHTAAPTP